MVAQGKRLSAPPWVEITTELTPLTRPQVLGPVKLPGGGEGKGSGG